MAHEIPATLWPQSAAGIGFQLQAIRKAIPAGEPNLHDQVDLQETLSATATKKLSIMEKLRVSDRTEAVATAIRSGVLSGTD